jgi:hypothetical protein
VHGIKARLDDLGCFESKLGWVTGFKKVWSFVHTGCVIHVRKAVVMVPLMSCGAAASSCPCHCWTGRPRCSEMMVDAF